VNFRELWPESSPPHNAFNMTAAIASSPSGMSLPFPLLGSVRMPRAIAPAASGSASAHQQRATFRATATAHPSCAATHASTAAAALRDVGPKPGG
jgi:hypothetical protein